MTHTRLLLALAILLAFTSAAIQPAQAQSSDTWKSIAIIGGSTAAGAYIGHKIAGPNGTWIGAGVGASVGYAIDRKRRQNEIYNQGYYDPNAGYYPGPTGGYYPNGVSNGGPYDPYGYPGNSYAAATSRRSQRRAK